MASNENNGNDPAATAPADDSTGGDGGGSPSIGSPNKLSTAPAKSMEVTTGLGRVKVHVQGDLSLKNKRPVFFTVHDIGNNHSSIQDFVDHPCMSEIKARSIFVHLDLPGQQDDAPDLADDVKFPTIQELGELLVPQVLDELDLKMVFGFGEGAGANVLVRFALAHPKRVLGLITVHLVSAGVGMLEKLKDSFGSGRRRPSEAFQQPFEQVISLHKFGQGGQSGSPTEDGPRPQPLLLESVRRRVASLNPKNLRKYVEAYMNRKEIGDKLAAAKTLDVLLVVGGRSQYIKGVVEIHGKMDKSHTSLLKVDNATDILVEAPEKLAQSMLLFVQGQGLLTAISVAGIEKARNFSTDSNSGDCPPGTKTVGAIGRRLSMQEYDLPRPRRLSLTAEQQAKLAK